MKNNYKQIQRTRDESIINFLDHFQCATTDTLHQLFFIKNDGNHATLRMAQNRLNKLVSYNLIKRDRENVTQQYFYYLSGRKPTSQLRHQLLITAFYRELHRLKGVQIHRFYRVTTGSMRPDAVIAYTAKERLTVAFLEVEISNKAFDIEKYIRYRDMDGYKEMGLSEMPKLIVVTNKRAIPEPEGIQTLKIKTDLSDIEKILMGGL